MITISQLTADLDRIKNAYGDLPIADSEGHLLPNLPPEVSAMPPHGMTARLPFEMTTESIDVKNLKKQLERVERDIDAAVDEIENTQNAVEALREML